jgi:hypothetical protein
MKCLASGYGLELAGGEISFRVIMPSLTWLTLAKASVAAYLVKLRRKEKKGEEQAETWLPAYSRFC